jgi:hypothetical protein
MAEVVERFVRLPVARGRTPFRRDLFNLGDVLAVEPAEPGCLLVQACMTGDQARRLAKVRAEPKARAWLTAGNRLEVWGWSKRGARGKRKLWEATTTRVGLSDLNGAP